MSNHLEILRQNGKSFYWAGKLLPKKYLIRCAELYSFCRLLDDIADTKTKDKNLIKLNNILNLFKKNDYQKLEENNIYVPSYLKNCELAKSKIIDLMHGLIFDQKLVRIKSEKELILYCYRVAGTVGVLMCIALECKNKNSFNFAIDLGIAMQLTNILRDIEEDAKLNRRYLPGKFINNLTPKEILILTTDHNHSNHSILKDAIKKILLISELYYKSGNKGLVFLNLKFRIAISIASNVYREIGVKLKKNKFIWYKGRIYTTNFEKLKLTLKTFIKISQLFTLKFPKHNQSLHKHLKEIL